MINNLWKILESSGLSKERVLELARIEGIVFSEFVNNGTEYLTGAGG